MAILFPLLVEVDRYYPQTQGLGMAFVAAPQVAQVQSLVVLVSMTVVEAFLQAKQEVRSSVVLKGSFSHISHSKQVM